LLDNIWGFFQIDVVEVQWQKLVESLKQERQDFEALRKSLEIFIHSLQENLFMNYQKIIKSLFKIVALASRLQSAIQKAQLGTVGSGMEMEGNGDVDTILQKIEEDLTLASVELFQKLILFNQYYDSPALFQLLLRLDYNSYFHSQIEMIHPSSNKSMMSDLGPVH
jgi:hypothetical protein